MRISDVCTRYAVDIGADDSVRDAAYAMRNSHVGALVVVDRGGGTPRPVGILTDRDIVVCMVATDVDAGSVRVGDVMSAPVITCGENDDVFDAVAQMRHRGVRRLPVVDADGALVGMLSADDLLGAISAELGDLSRAFSRGQAQEAQRRD